MSESTAREQASCSEQGTDLSGPRPKRVVIRAAHVTKRYLDGDVVALDNASLQVKDGEYVAIVGPSGSGKSTLLNVIGCLDQADSGELEIDGQLITRRTDLNALRSRKFGFVFQSFHLIPTLNARDNVMLPMLELGIAAKERVRRAEQLLAEVNLERRLTHLPAMLSIGERQRVAIARALANEPPILLADEPTGSLDSKNSEDILELFEGLRKQREFTLVMITHSEQLARRANRQIEVLDGHVRNVS